MNLNETCLTAESLDRLACNEFSPSELEQLEHHLDHCSRCAELIQEKSSAVWLNDSAIDVLQTPERNLTTTFRDDIEPSQFSYDHILKLLGPTDDPHRLGRIDAYEIVGIIGRGGAGVVFKAFDPALQRFVAIKMMLPHLAESAPARKRFAREAKAAAAVVDDYVLPIHGVAEWKGIPYIVSQFCRGETLQKRIDSVGPLEVKEIVRIAAQLAKGLAAAHAQGLVHRDVKPANVLLDQGIERVQLTDFGLARAMDDAAMTHTGVLAGTPQFMSPEQASGENLDGRSDLFALGTVIYTMCTGRPPFRGTTPLAVLQKIKHESHKSVQSINPDIPLPLSQLVDNLLEKRADDRFSSAAELARWLDSYLSYLQQPSGRGKPKLPYTRQQRVRTRSWILAIAASLMATVGGVFGWSHWSNKNADSSSGRTIFIANSNAESLNIRESGLGQKALKLARLIEVRQELERMGDEWSVFETDLEELTSDMQFYWEYVETLPHLYFGWDVFQQDIEDLKRSLELYEKQYSQLP